MNTFRSNETCLVISSRNPTDSSGPTRTSVGHNYLKLAWSYETEIWGNAAKSNAEILETFQLEFLGITTRVPLDVINSQLRMDLDERTVHCPVCKKAECYIGRLHRHPNIEAIMLLNVSEPYDDCIAGYMISSTNPGFN